MRSKSKRAAVCATSLFCSALLAGASLPAAHAQERKGAEGPQNRMRMERSEQGERNQRDADRPYWQGGRWGITDEIVEGMVVVKLAARSGMGDVDVEVDDGIATLKGTVASETAKDRAMRTTQSTLGVTTVRDNLKVDKSLNDRKAAMIDDAALAQRTARKIAQDIEGAKAGEDWWFDGWRVEGPYNRWNLVVEADDGNITLEGEVPQFDIIRKAVLAAREVEGVRTVDSDLEVERYYGYSPWGWRRGTYYGYAHPYYPNVMPPEGAASGRDHGQMSSRERAKDESRAR